jgi:PhnB protein
MNAPKNTPPPSVQPYLFFDGCCEEALNFYKTAVGAEVVSINRFKDSPEGAGCPGMSPDKIMHAMFAIRGSIILASDGQCTGKPSFAGFALSITARDVADAEKLFGALSQGGRVEMPLAETFFSPRFGMLADKFGVFWMIYVAPLGQA